MAGKTEPLVHMGTIVGGEARKLLQTNPVILLPMGSHEDQGPHAPMGDYLLAEKVAELTAIRASQASVRTLVAPVLPLGGADWFGPMIGGISISQATLTTVIAEMVESLHRNGLTRLIIFNGHAGNVEPIQQVARDLYRRQRVVLPSLYLWKIGTGLLPDILGGTEKAAAVVGHGADPIASVGMHLFPELSRMDLIPDWMPLKKDPVLDLQFTGLGVARFEGHEIGMPNEYDEAYNFGIGKGDPRLCSPNTGKAVTDKLTDVCVRFVQHFAACIPPTNIKAG